MIREDVMNGFIAQAMEKQAPDRWTVTPEKQGQARRGATRPDIVVHMPYLLRTIIETEYGQPALGDAKLRLGYEFHDYTLPMKSILAVGIPPEIGDMGHAERDEVLLRDDARFLMQVVTGSSKEDAVVAPEKPVLVSVRDLVHFAWLAAIPEPYAADIVRKVVEDLSAVREELAGRIGASEAGNVVGTLTSMVQLHLTINEWGGIGKDILEISNAELWQSVPPYNAIPHKIAAEWRKIEAIDYQPLSTIAADMLDKHGLKLGPTLRAIHGTLSKYVQSGIGATTNVAAEVWQAMIPDRDQRAAYYTKPITAELLASLATARLANPGAASYNELCAGTGTLARATEESIRFRHYGIAKKRESIHKDRMEKYLQLTDINPQSISVATANMTALAPEIPYGSSMIFAITADGGALNFLKEEGVSDMTDKLLGSSGAQTGMLAIAPNSVGICCNNDPYFRARGGAGGTAGETPQSKFKRFADKRVKGVANGQAGLATFMHVIEHTMLRYRAPHGKVLPLTAAHAPTWAGFRRNIENEYTDVIVISTAAGTGQSMSADTGMQEMLLVGTKHRNPQGTLKWQHGDQAVMCVNLTKPFTSKLEAKMYADAIRREAALGKPSGEIEVGSKVGTYTRMADLGEGKPWHALGLAGDYATLVSHLTAGRAWNPSTGKVVPFALPMATLSDVSTKGPTHHLLGSPSTSHDPGGAFVMHPSHETTEYQNPSLWEMDADAQTQISCLPTHFGTPRTTPAEAQRMQKTAGHFHLGRNLRTSSQKVAMAYTETQCMGGRSWTTLTMEKGVAEAVTLFMNSTYGVLVRSGYGMTTQLGRSTIQIRAIDGHPVPNFTKNPDATSIALEHFDQLRELPLNRIALTALDSNRAEIDRVVTRMLGLPWNPETENMLAQWRRLMCLQPAINGGNKEILATLAGAGIK